MSYVQRLYQVPGMALTRDAAGGWQGSLARLDPLRSVYENRSVRGAPTAWQGAGMGLNPLTGFANASLGPWAHSLGLSVLWLGLQRRSHYPRPAGEHATLLAGTPFWAGPRGSSLASASQVQHPGTGSSLPALFPGQGRGPAEGSGAPGAPRGMGRWEGGGAVQFQLDAGERRGLGGPKHNRRTGGQSQQGLVHRDAEQHEQEGGGQGQEQRKFPDPTTSLDSKRSLEQEASSLHRQGSGWSSDAVLGAPAGSLSARLAAAIESLNATQAPTKPTPPQPTHNPPPPTPSQLSPSQGCISPRKQQQEPLWSPRRALRVCTWYTTGATPLWQRHGSLRWVPAQLKKPWHRDPPSNRGHPAVRRTWPQRGQGRQKVQGDETGTGAGAGAGAVAGEGG